MCVGVSVFCLHIYVPVCVSAPFLGGVFDFRKPDKEAPKTLKSVLSVCMYVCVHAGVSVCGVGVCLCVCLHTYESVSLSVLPLGVFEPPMRRT